jgi:tetratricopeptide (TPR) repeat protein
VQAEKTFGPRHPGILHQKSRWASDLHMAGKIEESLQIYEEIIPLMEEVMGKSSYGTHHAKAFQARSICSLGRVDEALEILRETSVRLFDDTYINSLYAHLLVWDGLEEEFNKSRLRVLRDTLDVWFNSPRRIDTLERSVWIACLLPFSNDDERQLSEELLQRADEARALPGLSPRKSWYWNEEIFVRALAALRFGEHGKIPQKLRQIEDLRSRDESHGFVLCATRLVKVLSLLQTGNVVDARNLYERAIRDFGYTPDETKHPLNGRSLACGTFLLVPILAREAIRELEKAGAD